MKVFASLLTTVVVGLGISQAANAADLPQRYAPAAMASAPSAMWTGYYIGGHVGAGWSTFSPTATAVGVLTTTNQTGNSATANGFLGGVQAGYNWQVSPLFVVGIEGDFSWADIDGSSSSPIATIPFSNSFKTKWTADITGRVGFTAGNALIYLKGGVAWARNDYSMTLSAFGPATPFNANDVRETRTGGLIGTGVEYAITRNWSAKVEYNFIDFGNKTATFTGPVGGAGVLTVNDDINQKMHIMKAGVNYRW